MSYQWDGITKSSSVAGWVIERRTALADRARAYDWPGLFELLGQDTNVSWINAARLDGRSWYAPLHQAAHAGAPVEVARRLVELGAWRALRTADGERPLDIALRLGHDHLREALAPPRLIEVHDWELQMIQELFHGLIRSRAGRLVDREALRLPELEVLLETPGHATVFTIPGFYGGFHFTLHAGDGPTRLTTEISQRMGGSDGDRHEITRDEIKALG
ncbi:hypothetical protein [Micromonospora psammae]|uniref:hypothetical protein n=1 Tax=Micromonospora sp. CPCC 205556 TaxID=3122398 RepID=UPI002FEF49F4